MNVTATQTTKPLRLTYNLEILNTNKKNFRKLRIATWSYNTRSVSKINMFGNKKDARAPRILSIDEMENGDLVILQVL